MYYRAPQVIYFHWLGLRSSCKHYIGQDLDHRLTYISADICRSWLNWIKLVHQFLLFWAWCSVERSEQTASKFKGWNSSHNNSQLSMPEFCLGLEQDSIQIRPLVVNHFRAWYDVLSSSNPWDRRSSELYEASAAIKLKVQETSI